MIRPLTQWVLERTFRECSAWHRQGRTFTVAVNLSARDLHDPELPDLIAGIAAKTDMQPEKVVLEITEGSIMADPARVLTILERLRGMGFTLSIDDFGTGYSSLAYLRKLPVSELKIDRSFVMDMLSSENDAVIVRATVDLAHNLGLKVTAEGVENAQTVTALRDFGCDVAQGYFFSPPLAIRANPQTTSTFTKAMNTAALPISLARLARRWFSRETRSTAASMAELTSSTINTSSTLATMRARAMLSPLSRNASGSMNTARMAS